MTKDDIIRMAIDAGFTQEDDDIFVCGIEHIKKLLEIEREACVNTISHALYGQKGCWKAMDAIRAREYE